MNTLLSRTAAHPASGLAPAQVALSMTAQLPASQAPSPQARYEHRARDFGVGYGNSSGYASGKRYVRDWGPARFRCG